MTDSKGVQYPPAINATEEDDVTFKTGLASDTVLETAWKLMLHARGFFCRKINKSIISSNEFLTFFDKNDRLSMRRRFSQPPRRPVLDVYQTSRISYKPAHYFQMVFILC